MDNLEYKKQILQKLANDFVSLNQEGVVDQYPISGFYVFPNLLRYRNQIIDQTNKNFKFYSELKLIQVLQLVYYRPFDPPKELINSILDELIIRRVDPTLERSLDLKIYSENKLIPINVSDEELKKYILYAELNTDINYPIFRGFGFNIYTKNNLFYKEYLLNEKKFMYSAEIIKKPKYLMTGHNSDSGDFSKYKFYGTLPEIPQFAKFGTIEQKIEFALEKILKNLNVSYNNKEEIIVPENKESPKFTSEQKKIVTEKLYSFLISKVI